MSKKTGRMLDKIPNKTPGKARVGAGSAGRAPSATVRTTSPGNIAVGKSAGGKGLGKKFTPGASKPAARSFKRAAPKAGWKTWEDDNAAGGEPGARRGQDAVLEPVVPISPEVVEQLRRESQQSLVWSMAVQWSVSVIVALIALLIGGKAAGLSGLLGAACVALPNSLLAFKLLMNSMRPDGSGSTTTVLVGEFVKVVAVVLLLVLVVKLGGALIVWPALLAGLIAALKSYWVMLVLVSIQRKGP